MMNENENENVEQRKVTKIVVKVPQLERFMETLDRPVGEIVARFLARKWHRQARWSPTDVGGYVMLVFDDGTAKKIKRLKSGWKDDPTQYAVKKNEKK